MKLCIFLSLTASFILSISAHASRRATTRSTASQIRFLLDEEKVLRQRLEARVRRLRQQTANLNNTIVPCACTTSPPTSNHHTQVAYTGTSGPNSISGLNANSVFNFTHDLINIGHAFDPVDGHFVAPVDGLYGFSLAVYMAVRYTIRMELVANGKIILDVQTSHYYSSRYNRQENMAMNFAIVNITKGTDVWPRYVTGSGTLYGNGVPTFSGYLIHEF